MIKLRFAVFPTRNFSFEVVRKSIYIFTYLTLISVHLTQPCYVKQLYSQNGCIDFVCVISRMKWYYMVCVESKCFCKKKVKVKFSPNVSNFGICFSLNAPDFHICRSYKRFKCRPIHVAGTVHK